MAGDGTAFVLGGGGLLGACQVGMLRALLEADIRPDLVLGTSVGALNGALIAADPTPSAIEQLTELWGGVESSGVLAGSVVGRLATLARTRVAVHSNAPLRELLDRLLPRARIEELPVRFSCVAASIERAAEHWFSSGPLADAVLASAAVPGLLPAVRIGDEHFLDGGLVNSIPVGRAVALGARRIYVLQVGRVDQALHPPQWPWEVGLVAFEIARRHRFTADLAALDETVEVHVLPTGETDVSRLGGLGQLRYRDFSAVQQRIERAYDVTRTALVEA